MIKAGIVGFRGYSGAELIQILRHHGGAETFENRHRRGVQTIAIRYTLSFCESIGSDGAGECEKKQKQFLHRFLSDVSSKAVVNEADSFLSQPRDKPEPVLR